MNTKQAYKLGVASGEEAAELGDFLPPELLNRASFISACFEICENKRQYAGHPGYDFNGQTNGEALWDAFEEGEGVGIRKGWRKRQTAKAYVLKQHAVTKLDGKWYWHTRGSHDIRGPFKTFQEAKAALKKAINAE